MTRKELIKSAAQMYVAKPNGTQEEQEAFIAGATWADTNPSDWAFTQMKLKLEQAHGALAVAEKALEFLCEFQRTEANHVQAYIDDIIDMRNKASDALATMKKLSKA